MPTNYLMWGRDIVNGACSLSPLTGFDDSWQLLDGIPLSASFPSTAQLHFDPDDPTGIKLTDSLYNANRLIVASARLRELLETAGVPQVEYLQVPIYNHKQRQIDEPYCIVHPLEPVDCLVTDQCEPRWGRIDKTNIDRLKRFVIDESKIEAGRLLFRPKHYKRAILIHRALAQKIDAAGLTGMRWIELSDYPEE